MLVVVFVLRVPGEVIIQSLLAQLTAWPVCCKTEKKLSLLQAVQKCTVVIMQWEVPAASEGITWRADGDSLFIHKPEGSFHWREVCHEPVWLSLAEAQAYAKSRGARIMSESEYQCILADPEAFNR